MALGFGGFQVSASQLQVLRVRATGQCVMDVGVVLNMVSVSHLLHPTAQRDCRGVLCIPKLNHHLEQPPCSIQNRPPNHNPGHYYSNQKHNK